MNKVLITWASFVAIAVVLVSAANYYQTHDKASTNNAAVNTAVDRTDSFDWMSVLMSMPQYQPKTVEPSKQQTETERLPQLSDAKLVAIIVDQPTTAMLVVPSEEMSLPVGFTVGEGWLEGWTIASINADAIVWQNQNNNDTVTQYLFE